MIGQFSEAFGLNYSESGRQCFAEMLQRLVFNCRPETGASRQACRRNLRNN
ncbi:MAG: hypothetical protein LBE12_00535 [Planctomycetaceae bacterium]|jgi:hypothetical protein|nr:hypothetical protein [Planctomycetaceae bacterium]